MTQDEPIAYGEIFLTMGQTYLDKKRSKPKV